MCSSADSDAPPSHTGGPPGRNGAVIGGSCSNRSTDPRVGPRSPLGLADRYQYPKLDVVHVTHPVSCPAARQFPAGNRADASDQLQLDTWTSPQR